MNRFCAMVAMSGLLALGACGGGGSSGPSSADTRELTGLAAPTETVTAQNARVAGIVSRADSLIISAVHGETSHPALPSFNFRSRCAGTRCSLSEPRIGYSVTFYLSDFEFVSGSTDSIGTKHGITLMSDSGRHMGADYISLGAWMEHGAFIVQTESATVEGYRISVRYGMAGGDLAGTRPAGTATWTGIMVGTPATGNNRDDRLQGNAALNYDSSAGGSLDVAFTSIKNIDRGTAHSTPTVLFSDVPVGLGGTFEAGLAGNRIQGGFYGPAHVEALGIFEQSNIVGAFGAKR